MKAKQIDTVLGVMLGLRWHFGRLEDIDYLVCVSCKKRQSTHQPCELDSALQILREGIDQALLDERKPIKPATTLTREDLERIMHLVTNSQLAIQQQLSGRNAGMRGTISQLFDDLATWFPET